MFTDEQLDDDRDLPPADHGHFESPQPKRTVRVCQNTTCTKDGALAVFQAFQNRDLPDFEVVATGCLGCCGNGPMVLVLPDATWYSRVQPRDVKAIATQHLEQGHTVTALLDRQKHPPLLPPAQEQRSAASRSLTWAYLALTLALLGAIAAIGWTLWAWA